MSRRSWRRPAEHRRERESGAVAVMVALLALALMCVAALSVDLGNAWARARTVQRQADVVALSAGSLLPMSVSDARTDNDPADFADRAAEVLNQNLASGQAPVVASQLVDGALANGEVEFLDGAGQSCADNCTRIRLTPPAARVDFGFARAFGRSGADVSRAATVEVFSGLPPKDKLIPLWLPNGCGYGPVDGDTTGGAASSPTSTSSSPTATGTGPSSPTSSAAAQVPITPVGTHTLGGISTYAVSYGGSVMVKNLTIMGVSKNTKKASIRAISPDGTRYTEYASADVKKSSTSFTVADFTIASELSLTPGTWKLYAVIQGPSSLSYSSNFFTVEVAPGPGDASSSGSATPTASATPSNIPVGCAGQSRGNFGQLDSPRKDGTSGQSAMALNFALGLDHLLMPFDFGSATPVKSCVSGSSPIPGGQWDSVSRDGNNCIKGDTGNDGPWTYKGIVTGLNGKPGRLDVANGTTTCPSEPGSRSNVSVGGKTLNNDVLSCFLRNDAVLSDLASDTADQSMLDPTVIDSPRFVWLPVVVATDRAQKEFQPILDFVPAFITDETQVSEATSDNGLQINGNSIKVLRLFAFNKEALPPNEQSPEVDYDTTIANPIVHLIG